MTGTRGGAAGERGGGDAPRAERLFLAVTIPADVRDAIRAALPRTLPGRVVRPEHWHLTLRFLGDTETRRRAELTALLERAAASGALGAPFALRFAGLGAFPDAARARVLWLGATDGAHACAALAGRLEEVAQAAGFNAERRGFSVHLTLSRLDPPRDVRALVAKPADVAAALAVHAVSLYRSELTPAGPRYAVVTRVGLPPDAEAATR